MGQGSTFGALFYRLLPLFSLCLSLFFFSFNPVRMMCVCSMQQALEEGEKKRTRFGDSWGERNDTYVRSSVCVLFASFFFKGVSPPSAFVSLRLHAPYYTVMTVERVRIRRTRVLLFHPRVCSSFFFLFAFFFFTPVFIIIFF